MGRLISEELFARMRTWDVLAFEEFIALTVQEALKTLPLVNESIVKRAGALRELSDQFYRDNKDLAGNKELVGKTIEQVESENPGMKFEEILKRAAPRARSIMQSRTTASPKRHLDEVDSIVGRL